MDDFFDYPQNNLEDSLNIETLLKKREMNQNPSLFVPGYKMQCLNKLELVA